jgi:hypothetical protein
VQSLELKLSPKEIHFATQKVKCGRDEGHVDE